MSDDANRFFDSMDEWTRRRWILRLGEFVALAGLSGLVPEVAATLVAQPAELAKAMDLPPGLYQPSQDHLVHALSSGSKNWAPPPGSETEYALASATPFQPQFFPPEDFKVVMRVIEVLLGKVDPAAALQAAQWVQLQLRVAPLVRSAALQLDPLHRVLAVAYYGQNDVRELETAHPEAVARAGIRALRDLSHRLYDRDFLRLTDAEQTELLTTASHAEAGTAERTFLELVRAEAIRGYYTSAEGLKELDYKGNAYYGECPGCEGRS